MSAIELLLDAASDMPAMPSTDIALLGCFSLEARFTCGIAEFLLHFPWTKCATPPYMDTTVHVL